ncbi:MAG TPA: M20/M25/M40 family metallo-hydrolase [Bryobacteraceae bacterium]|nr:M20/M25/M40 family metallo-hydrolase [Bryobacteraceae bacterium]
MKNPPLQQNTFAQPMQRRHFLTAGMAALALQTGAGFAAADTGLRDRTARYFTDLLRLDTSNPPGNETRAAEYLKTVAVAEGIPCELLGPDPRRLNFIARLKGSGARRPLLLMAHSDVVPVDRSQWSVDPFGAVIKNGVIYGRGAEDVKSLLAAELAVLVDLKRRSVRLDRDIILLAEADEEAASTGITWLIQNAWEKIDADFALNEFGYWQDEPSGERVFQIQTTEKIPTRVRLMARGVAGHGSLPRPDNPVAHLAKAITRLVEAEQPVDLNTTTRRYLSEMANLPQRRWLQPLIEKLDDKNAAGAAVMQIRERDPELDAMLHTTVSPTMLGGGVKINVIPNTAEAQFDVRRLPTESEQGIYERFRQIVNDPAVTIEPEGQQKPATEPSSLTSPLYLAMERVFQASHPRARVAPFMMRGATDGAYLRAKGMAVYGVPLFGREGEPRWHGNDERISVRNLQDGAELLLKIVLQVAVPKP